ncbi:MAG: hypothetical protein JWQ78_369, partial [Sediminibacterium sp.]|nr:hypothetical protein [Sediminibacterium sp.]
MKYLPALALFIFTGILSVSAQTPNALPEFSVRELTRGKIQVSWNNPYPSCIQLAVQRSLDSVNNFRTIFSTLSPELPSNGFVDNKPLVGIRSYYRIFYVLLGGAYYFTKPIAIDAKMTNPAAEAPVPKVDPKNTRTRGNKVSEANAGWVSIYRQNTELFKLSGDEYLEFRDSINRHTKDGLRRINEHAVEWKPVQTPRKNRYTIFLKDRLLAELDESAYKKYRDSIAANTKDTLFAVDPWRIQLHLFAANSGEYMYI